MLYTKLSLSPGVLLGFICLLLSSYAPAQAPFITTWKTDKPGVSNSTSIYIKLGAGDFNYNVDWDNDGVYDEFGITGEITHDFGVAGTYTIAITGDFPNIRFEHGGDSEKLLDIAQWGDIKWESMIEAFDGCKNLTISATDAPDLSRVTTTQSMFLNCRSMNSDLNHWDVSNITTFGGMFHNAVSFNKPLNNWVVSNGVSFNNMFLYASTFNQDLSSWNTGSAINMGAMFQGASAFNGDITAWNVENVKNMASMFKSANSFNKNISNWNVGKVTSMENMFQEATAFNQDLNGWNVAAVTNMSNMFSDAAAFNGNITNWNVGQVTNFSYMFNNADNFNNDIGGWNVSQGTTFTRMFAYADGFNQDIGKWNMGRATRTDGMFLSSKAFNYPLAKWDVSNVENMAQMFSQGIFNQDINTWNTGKATNMSQMFWNNRVFNTPIAKWDVSSVTNMSEMFRGTFEFNQDIADWNIESLESMRAMFMDTYKFNQDISKWNVANVTDFSAAFSLSREFNQDIGNWNTSSATNMSSMFNQNPVFNQDLSAWNVSQVTDMSGMFRYTTSFDQNLGDWNVGSVTTMQDMFASVTLSTKNYDSLLISWLQHTLQNGVTFNAGKSVYCTGADARAKLISNFGWTITDGGGETTAPTAICQDITLYRLTDGSVDFAANNLDGGSTDNCSALSFASIKTAFDCSQVGSTFSVPLTVTDAVGNSSTCTANVTLLASLDITCPTDTIVTTDNWGSCSKAVSWQVPAVACGVTLTASHSPGDSFPVGTTTVTYTAEDALGNTNSCSFEVSVLPNLTIPCPANLTLTTAIGECTVATSWAAPTAACGLTLTADNTNGAHFALGDNAVTYTAEDAYGNTSSCSFTIRVQPALDFSCPANISLNLATDECGKMVNWTEPTANCGVSITSNLANGSEFTAGTTTVTYTAEDEFGNTNTCSFEVEIVPSVEIKCNVSLTAYASKETCLASVLWLAPEERCGTTLTSTYNPGDFLPLGETEVTYTRTNDFGDTAKCSFTITVLPSINISCPADVIVRATDNTSCEAQATWKEPIVSCGVTLSSSHSPGHVFATGTTKVTYTAQDDTGRKQVCSFNVTVLPALEISCPANIELNLAAGVCSATAIWTEPTPACGLTLSSTHNPGDEFPIGSTEVAYTVTDALGNSKSCSFTVKVYPALTFDCPANLTIAAAQDACSSLAIWTGPTANCGTVLSSDYTSGSDFPIGVTTVTYTAQDEFGNTSSCEFTVTVLPNLSLSCPANIITYAPINACETAVSWTEPEERCGTLLNNNYAAGSTFALGTTTVEYARADEFGNKQLCSFTVTVLPSLDFSCPANITVRANSPAECQAPATWAVPEVACGIKLSGTYAAGSLFAVGTTEVNYTATDDFGNLSSCSFTVTVLPSLQFNCPANLTLEANQANCSAIASWANPNVACNVNLSADYPSGTVFPLGTTTVTYTATDVQGNSQRCSFLVTVKSTLNLDIEKVSNLRCFEDNSGEVATFISGGVAPYTYIWSTIEGSEISTAEDLTGASAGEYTIMVTDAIGCSFTSQATLTQPDVLAISADLNQVPGLSEYTLDLNVVGGTEPYSYSWTSDQLTEELTTKDATILNWGYYTVTVEDAQGCTAMLDMYVDPADIPCNALKYSLYPNPNQGVFNIDFEGCTSNATIEIFDMLGRKLHTYETSKLHNVLDINSLGSAQYIVRVRAGKNVSTKMMIVRP